MIVDVKSGIKVAIDCPKCCGDGGFAHFAHVQNGICFMCKGSKKTFSYNCPNQRDINRRFKDKIEELENGYYVTKELINEFCSIKEHQTVWFSKFSTNWVYKQFISEGLRGSILSDIDHLINCNQNFMYE